MYQFVKSSLEATAFRGALASVTLSSTAFAEQNSDFPLLFNAEVMSITHSVQACTADEMPIIAYFQTQFRTQFISDKRVAVGALVKQKTAEMDDLVRDFITSVDHNDLENWQTLYHPFFYEDIPARRQDIFNALREADPLAVRVSELRPYFKDNIDSECPPSPSLTPTS